MNEGVRDESGRANRRAAPPLNAGQQFVIFSLVLCLSSCSRRPPTHGTAFLVALDTNYLASGQNYEQALERAREVLCRRLDNFGVGCFIEPEAQGRLLIKVPPLKNDDLSAVRQVMSKPGLLEFRMVHPNNEDLVRAGTNEPGFELLKEIRRFPDGKTSFFSILVKKQPERGLTGKYIRRASVLNDPVSGAPGIVFEFNAEGARLFELITTDYQPAGDRSYRLAIVLDGELRSAPRITGVISGGQGVINGNFTAREAFELANILARPLEVPVRVVEERTF